VSPRDLRALLRAFRAGSVTADEVVSRLRAWPVSDVGFAKLDGHREARCGFPEVVLGLGKEPHQVARLVAEIARRSPRVLATRTTAEAFEATRRLVPQARFEAAARAIVVDRERRARRRGLVAVVTAGKADIPVAEEARVTAELFRARVESHFDCGVAGLHRLVGVLPRLRRARVVVVVAGMEGALPSVVGGLVACPVVAVPTSVGYGAGAGGIAPLLAMMNSCAAGVSVVNVDNGFGAGYLAGLVNARGRL
jgi:hypothetical protein